MHSDEKLLERIRSGDQSAFEEMFYKYCSSLCVFSNSYVKSMDTSYDVVQDVFVKIWENRANFYIHHSLKAYLYQAVRNQSLKFLEKNKQKIKLQKRLEKQQNLSFKETENHINTEELSQKVWKLVEKLPERRRTIFLLYRKNGLSYSEIGEVMGITRKTVENQMGKSLQFLRENLDV